MSITRPGEYFVIKKIEERRVFNQFSTKYAISLISISKLYSFAYLVKRVSKNKCKANDNFGYITENVTECDRI